MNQIDVPFGEAVERLCANCRWPLSTDNPVLPLGAAVIKVDSLAVWLDREPEDEEDVGASLNKARIQRGTAPRRRGSRATKPTAAT